MMQDKKFQMFILGSLVLGVLLTQPLVPKIYADDDMWSKLGRGVNNVATGWMEVGYQPAQMAEEKRWPIALAGGIPKGIFYAYMRTMVGLYETVTFFVPAPKDYKPIIQPEFIVPE